MKINSILLKTAVGIALGVVLSGYLFIDFPSKFLSHLAFAAKSGVAQTGEDDPGQIQVADEGDFVISERQGRIDCRSATREEAQAMRRREPNQQMQVITPVTNDLAEQAGLKIVLRGTPQLDSFPAARDAFLRAAAKWESLIQTPITIILDVDFGPKRFDETFEPTTIGSTSGQTLRLPSGYPSIRSRLISRASGRTRPRS